MKLSDPHIYMEHLLETVGLIECLLGDSFETHHGHLMDDTWEAYDSRNMSKLRYNYIEILKIYDNLKEI